MTRIHRIETCDGLCPHAVGSRGCRHPEALWDDAGIIRIRPFEDFPHIPAWCPLEQVGPDWRPPEPPQTEPPRDDRNFREALREVVETRPQKGPRWMRQGSGPWPLPGLKPARRERG